MKIYDISHRCDAVRIYEDITPSLTARCGTGGGNVPLIVQTYSCDDYSSVNENTVSPTLRRDGLNYGGAVKP